MDSYIVNALNQFGNYESSNDNLKIPNLEQRAQELISLSNDVATKVQQLQVIRTNRSNLSTELKDRVQCIKSYIKA